MDLGAEIKKQRKIRGLNQVDFSKSCDITQTYLSQIENNLREPALATLKTIAEKFDMPLPLLFFLSFTADDIKQEKREAFKMVFPSMKAFVSEFFNN